MKVELNTEFSPGTKNTEVAGVFLHGFSLNASYSPLSVFKETGYSTLTFDLPGHGRSGPLHDRFSYPDFDSMLTSTAFRA